MKKISVFKIIVYRQRDGLDIYFFFTFCVFESWSRDQSEYTNIFHRKTQFLAIVLKYYRDIRKQVFFVYIVVLWRHKRPNVFRSAFAKEILSMIQFLLIAKLLSAIWLLFSIFLIIFLRKAMLNLINRRISGAAGGCPEE